MSESGIPFRVYENSNNPRESEDDLLDPEKYRTNHVKSYVKPIHMGFSDVPVLEFLKGRKWDKIALAYVHSLRPSGIRVITNWMTADAYSWRVTVVVDSDDIIQKISQEVEVGLPDGVNHGHGLSVALEHGIDSEELKSLQNGDDMGIYNPAALSKVQFTD